MRFLLSFFLLFVTSITSHSQIPKTANDICPLLIGEKIPDMMLKGPDGTEIRLMDSLATKPTIIIVYRGGWCPFCNRHLAEIGERMKEITELGYQVIAISPDAKVEADLTQTKNNLPYQIYSDGSGEFSKAVGIAFEAPERYNEKLLKYSDNENTGFLPVPSLFVVNREGFIRFEYINPEYKERMSADLLIEVLKSFN